MRNPFSLPLIPTSRSLASIQKKFRNTLIPRWNRDDVLRAYLNICLNMRLQRPILIKPILTELGRHVIQMPFMNRNAQAFYGLLHQQISEMPLEIVYSVGAEHVTDEQIVTTLLNLFRVGDLYGITLKTPNEGVAKQVREVLESMLQLEPLKSKKTKIVISHP